MCVVRGSVLVLKVIPVKTLSVKRPARFSHKMTSAGALLVAFMAAFGVLLMWLHDAGQRRRRQPAAVTSLVPDVPPGCEDHDAKCIPNCSECFRLAVAGCSRCEALGPQCNSSSRKANSSGSGSRSNSNSNSNRNSISNSNEHAHAQRRPIRWLHFPKCGSTLAVSILNYACDESVPAWHAVGMALRGGRIDIRMAHAIKARHATRGARCNGRLLLPFDGHRPVSPAPVPGRKGSSTMSFSAAIDPSLSHLVQRAPPRDSLGLVAMFRRPSQRLISAYLDNLHAWGLSPSARRVLKTRARSVAAFVRFPGIAGCMAKMLAGHQCAAEVGLRDGKLVRAALAVLRSDRFAFVGLTEEWDTSICLLHRMLPGASRPLLAEFRHLGHSVNSHRALSWLPHSDVEGEYNESVLDGFVDEADEAVYLEAERIFQRDLRRYGVRPRRSPALDVRAPWVTQG